jgi:hypothetical protein
MIINGCNDKRLNKFVYDNPSVMHASLQKKIKSILGLNSRSTCEGFLDDEVTIVTACDPKYVEHLKATLPNWIKHKHLDNFPMIVYINGFKRPRRNKDLEFLRRMPNVKLIEWDMPEAESQREKMLTAFVIGAARDVKTPYWVKIDADAFATDDSPLLTPEMKKYVICGHKWGYSFAKHIAPLIEWANKQAAFKNTPQDIFDASKVDGRRYSHQRVASYVQFHKSDFVRMAAAIAGNRLPVPSHDTYLWYVANRLGLPILRHNFKRKRGMSNKSDLNSLISIVNGIDSNVTALIEENDFENSED